MKNVDIVKWIATAIQLIGYGLTGLNIVPWNVFAFFHWDSFVVSSWLHVER